MRILFVIALIALTSGAGDAERLWVNNITLNEYNMTWSYTETYTGADSISYRMSIDEDLGDNDSFVNAWEFLIADKEMRKRLRSSIDKEQDFRINNGTAGIQVIDVDSALSPEVIGKTHVVDAIVNKYRVSYLLKDRVLDAGSIWFLGQAKTPVTIVMPAGVDVVSISGMDNITKNITDHTVITGFFKEISKDRGEITLELTRNTSFRMPDINVSNITSPALTESATKPMTEMASKIRDASILIAGGVIILFIYAFKVKRR